MKYQSQTRFLRISPRKIRFILPQIRGRQANAVLEMLPNRSEKAAKLLIKSLKSAVDAAKAKEANEDDLLIFKITADDGPRIKRRLIKSRGRADLIQKRMTHLTIILKDKKKRKKGKKVDQSKKI